MSAVPNVSDLHEGPNRIDGVWILVCIGAGVLLNVLAVGLSHSTTTFADGVSLPLRVAGIISFVIGMGLGWQETGVLDFEGEKATTSVALGVLSLLILTIMVIATVRP